MSDRGTMGRELQRVRVARGLSVEAAAASAKLTPEVWEALEAERAAVYVLTPQMYAAAAQGLGVKWTLVYG